MANKEYKYTPEIVKQDVRALFVDNEHWAYHYGSKAVSCSKDSVFYKNKYK